MAKALPTSKEDLKRINDMFDATENLISQLYGRWLNEKDYEDIHDYKRIIEQSIPKGFTILKMVKRPFGFRFSIGTEAEYSVYCKATSVGWNRV